jgi:hypothetical protein
MILRLTTMITVDQAITLKFPAGDGILPQRQRTGPGSGSLLRHEVLLNQVL